MLNTREILIYFSLISEGDVKKIIDLIVNKTEFDEVEARALISTVKSKTLTLVDRDYPNYLKEMQYPPIVLYYYGDISLIYDDKQNISVVGSRENTEYGASVTKQIVKDLSKKKNIVSGMAYGIDSIAHQTALDNNGKTVAVLGSGIDYCYPYQNLPLYRKIKAKGLLISEYPNFLTPKDYWFVSRNRLVAGFSKSLLVTEAKVKSGTAITVDFALAQGKTVFCVPDQAGKESGCNAMIRDGAVLVETADDILYDTEGEEKNIETP